MTIHFNLPCKANKVSFQFNKKTQKNDRILTPIEILELIGQSVDETNLYICQIGKSKVILKQTEIQ
jgi:hypothetical protein